MLERFAVFLDNPDSAYFPGQTVTGIVHVWNDQPKILKGIYAECRGLAKVHFTKDEEQWRTVRTSSISFGGRQPTTHRERSNVTVHYQSNEDYFYHRVPLLDQGGVEFQLPKGRHQYPFSFVLPTQIPSSFEGVHGHVRYTICAVIQRPQKSNRECRIPFSINTIVDLNVIPESMLAAHVEDFKTMGLFCCQSGPITAKVWLERVGYVPGEVISFNAEVENLSRKKMRGTTVQIVEMTSFHASGHTKEYERILFEKKRGEFNALEIWEDYPIIVPPLAPSNLPFCQIIRAQYIIRFSVDPGALSFNLVVPLIILIGNVPLRSTFHNFEDSALAAVNRGLSSFLTPPPLEEVATYVTNNLEAEELVALNQYPDLPPRTFEECGYGADIREPNDSGKVTYGGGCQFNPRYLTYHGNKRENR